MSSDHFGLMVGGGHVRTEHQIPAHQGPTGIRAADRAAAPEGGRTLTLATPAPWTREAKCLDDWKAFAGDADPKKHVAAQLCAGCPVIEECLEAAMVEERGLPPAFRAGVRGGKTPAERHRIEKGIPTGCGRHPADAQWFRANGRAYCSMCQRERDAERADMRVRIECEECGKLILKRHRNRHYGGKTCVREEGAA